MNEANKAVAMGGAPMTKRRLRRHWKLACAAVLAFGLGVGRSAADGREHEDHDVWFVHATDPHIFIQPTKDAREKQEGLNREALSEMLKRIRSLPEGDGPPAFLVLTGDLGVDPCDIVKSGNQSSTPTPAEQGKAQPPAEADKQEKQAAPPATQCLNAVDPEKRKKQIEETAKLLGQSPVPDIYLVAGNNDIAKESADDAALLYFNQFIDEVQAKLAENKSSVRLHNLTRCYALGEAPVTCYADIAHTAYRLIGFPSYSFKNEIKDEKASVANTEAQAKQMETFWRLLEDSRQAGKKVLVISHTPEMDDPYFLAQSRYATPTPVEAVDKNPNNPRSAWSTWNVSKKVLDDWKDVLASDSVVAVLAGHLHDSHKEIYRQPYRWSSVNEHRAAFHKLFLAPPLAVKNQDSSPIQARGFSLMQLQPDCIASQLFWYNSETQGFSPDPKPKHRWEQHWFWQRLCQRSHTVIMWLWGLGDAQNSKSLDRMAMLLIAILATFLTVVAVWQIPPIDNPLTGEPAKPKPAFEPSPFSGNFGGTIIAGLAGLAAAAVLKAFENKPSAVDKEFYVVWFIISFFVLLVLAAFLRGVVEALRSRFAIIYYPLPRPAELGMQFGGQHGQSPPPKKYWRWPGKLWRWLAYLFHAGLHWLSSLRVPLLTFSDTFTNLIQGKNQTITQVFSDKIVDQQRSVLRVANTIRKQLNNAILDYLRNETGTKFRPDDVRVNISVLSVDQSSVFYISRVPGSSRLAFLKRSVAWVSVFTGKIRWYKHSYSKGDFFKDIILFDNSAGTIAGDEPQIHLNSNYQPRGGEDYEAFVMFPVPWPQRGLGSDYVKGAIHISFCRETDFERVWSFTCTPEEAREKATKQVDAKIQAAANDTARQQLRQTRLADIDAAVKAAGPQSCDPVIDQHKYQSEQRMLADWCKDPEVRATLNTAVGVLGEVLRGFNEHIYTSIGKSEQGD
jgi:hypothetical protein